MRADAGWTIQCHTPNEITLDRPDVLYTINGVGTGSFLIPLNDYLKVRCDDRNLQLFWYRTQRRDGGYIRTDLNVSAALQGPTDGRWSVKCYVKTSGDEVKLNAFIPGTKVEASPTNSNPNLLRNVVAAADGTNCANHLLGLEDIIADIMLVPEDLCIHYTPLSGAGGYYFRTSDGPFIQVGVPPERSEETERKYVYRDRNGLSVWAHSTLIHELCHAQQAYYTFSLVSWAINHPGPEFATITGHRKKEPVTNTWSPWYYPPTGQYAGMYGTRAQDYYTITETAAEFCVAFAASNKGRMDIANTTISDIIPSQEMTQRIIRNQRAREFIDKYMLNINLTPAPRNTAP